MTQQASLVSGELGDFICTEGDCSIGRALIAEMNATFASLASTPDFVKKFSSTVESLKLAYERADTFWVHWAPFHPGCCSIKQIGFRAQDLTTQMRVYAGVADPPHTDPGGPAGPLDTLLTLTKWLVTAGIATLIGAGIYYGVRSIQTVSSGGRYGRQW